MTHQALRLTVLLLLIVCPSALAEDPPSGFKALNNQIYARYGEQPIALDLFLPTAGTKPYPTIVYIHGGGWRGGSQQARHGWAVHMARRGYAGACIGYRKSHEARYPAAVHDCKAAVRWLRAVAGKYGLDPKRIGVVGISSGGHLAAMLGTTAGQPKLEGAGGNPKQSSTVQAVAALFPPTDLVSRGKRNPELRRGSVYAFLGATYAEKPKLWAEASPITHVSKRSAPFLILHGTADRGVPYEESVRFLAALKKAGGTGELFTAKGQGHAFEMNPDWEKKVLAQLETFFGKTLAAPRK